MSEDNPDMADRSESETYAGAWADLRLRYRNCLIVWLACIPCAVLIRLPLSHVIGQSLSIVAVFFVSFILLSWSYGGLEDFECPRCGKPYFWADRWHGSPLRAKCAHCKLPKYAPPKDADNQIQTG